MYLLQNYSGVTLFFNRYLLVMDLPLKGIIPPMVTPLLQDGALDLLGLNKLVEHILAGGVHGLFLLGTTGEGTSLTHKLQKQLVMETCALVEKRVPLLVCITDTSLEESLELADYSKQVGADVLVLAPPFYLPISQLEMQGYLETIVPRLPLPFMMYNMPSCTKMNLSIDTVRKARQLGAIGIKDSSGDMDYMNALIEEFQNDPNFSLITGSESQLPATILKGGHGSVAGGANFFPRLFVNLYEASLVNDASKIELLLEKVIQLENTIYAMGENLSKYIKGTKSALATMGICNDFVAPPLQRLAKNERSQIKSHMVEFFSHVEYSFNK